MKSRCFRAIGLATSFLALFVMLGGHWLALQSVAWARMLVEFSQTDSFSDAVEKTFDGEHPCPMCVNIRDGRQQEERSQSQTPLLKLEKSSELFCEIRGVQIPVPPVAAEDAVAFVPRWLSDFIDSPPSPPPRTLSV
ncbi:MAG TPA: hypothetical protein VK327_16755 [Candidatus Paceibacterota bacterium]|nr:hypothetical protein [Candidatus Paceibacterota bacterium]